MLTFLLVLMTAASPWISLAYIQTAVTRRDHTLMDRVFQDCVLWETHSRSLRECSVLCITDSKCSVFTLQKKPSGGNNYLCRAYYENVERLKFGQHAVMPGVVFFSVISRWINGSDVEQSEGQTDDLASSTAASSSSISSSSSSEQNTSPGTHEVTSHNSIMLNSSCSSHEDCSAQQNNTACYSGTCVCSPGYYYSISTGACVRDCAAENLTTSYTRYAHHYLLWLDDEKLDVTSLQDCFDRCVTSNISCRSINLKHSGWGAPKCFLSSSVALSAGSSTFFSYRNFDHYQRQCL